MAMIAGDCNPRSRDVSARLSNVATSVCWRGHVPHSITDTGVLVRTRVSEIRELGRATQGVTLSSLDEGAKLSGLQRSVENDANAAELDAADAPPPADA